jgi:primary-amine oxidase
VAPLVAAPHHQHFFNFRLDFDVDGVKNSVVEANTSSIPAGDDNPYLNAFKMEETVLMTEKEGQRELSLEQARKWLVVNPSVKNSFGMPTAFAFIPGDNSVPYILPESWSASARAS